MRRVGFVLAVAVCLVGWGEEEEPPAGECLQMAELLEGEGDSSEEALDLFERAWERGGELKDEERLRVLKGMDRLRESVKRKKPRKVLRYRVLGVIHRGVNWKGSYDGRKFEANYPYDARTVRAVQDGFNLAIERMDRASGDSLKFEGKFAVSPDEIRSLSGGWSNTFYIGSEDYRKTRAPTWREGEYQAVIVYLLGNRTDDNSVPMQDSSRGEYMVDGACFRNFLWSPQYAIDNGATGAEEVRFFYQQIRDLLVNWNGYSGKCLPRLAYWERERIQDADPCYRAPDVPDMASFDEHLVACHVTPRMWGKVVRFVHKGFCIRNWACSRVFPCEERDEFGEKDFLGSETDPSLDVSGWTVLGSSSDAVNLESKFGPRNLSMAYAASFLHAREEVEVLLSFGGYEGFGVFLNGKKLYLNKWDTRYDSNVRRVRLQKGANLLLVKSYRDDRRWCFKVRVSDLQGRPSRSVSFSVRPKG